MGDVCSRPESTYYKGKLGPAHSFVGGGVAAEVEARGVAAGINRNPSISESNCRLLSQWSEFCEWVAPVRALPLCRQRC